MKTKSTFLLKMFVVVLLLIGSAQLYSQTTVSTLSTDRFVQLNGTKTFQTGYYSDGQFTLTQMKYEADQLASAGINTMTIDNTALSAADLSTFIDYCGTIGVNVMIDFYNNVDLTSINNNKTKKALIGYFSDDAYRFTTAQMQTRENTIKSADPNHLHISDGTAGDLTNNLALSQSMASITDGWICQWYPVSNDGSQIQYSSGVFTKTEDVVCAPNNALSGGYIQIYNWNNSGNRFPTAAEGRAMIYVELISGSRALWFYTFHDYVNNSTVNLSQTALWNETKNVSLNLKNGILGTVILNGTLTKNITTNNSSVNASYWVYNGDTYLIAVNSSTGSVSATISYDATGKTISAMLSNIPGTLTFNSSTKQLTGTMAAMEVQAIKLSNSSTIAVTGVTVSPTTASVAVGATSTLTATVSPSNATNKSVSWSSSNTAIATVSTSGVVTGVAAGSATITVQTTDGAKTATCAVTVTAASSDVVVNFENRTTDGYLTGTYANISWPTTGTVWYTSTCLGSKGLWLYNNSTSQQTITFTLPSGKVLKSLKIAVAGSPATKQVIISSTGNTTKTWTNMTNSYAIYTTGWTVAADTITVKVTCSSGDQYIYFDDITYGALVETLVTATTNENVFVYPNPATCILTIGNLKANSCIMVIGIDGKTISKQKAINETIVFDVSNWKKGMYILNIRNGNETVVKKAVIQ